MRKMPDNAVMMLERMEKLCGKFHRGQRRKGSGLPYKYHLYDVTKRVAGYGVTSGIVLSAAMGHDLLEDTDATGDDIADALEGLAIENGASASVLRLIGFCTRPGDVRGARDKILWLDSLRSEDTPSAAVAIKLADRVCNVLDYRDAGRKEYAARYAAQALPVYQRVWSWADPDDDFLRELPDAPKSLDRMRKDCELMRNLVLEGIDLDIINASLDDVIQANEGKQRNGKQTLRPREGADGAGETGCPQ